MISVGLTGGIGSGKSMVSRLLRTFGYNVSDSDSTAKFLMNNDTQVKSQIVDLMGSGAYNIEGIDTKYISDKIFADDSLRAKLNKIVHDKVMDDYELFKQKYFKEKFVFQESALLFETGLFKKHDFTVLVTSPLELRIKRLVDKGMSLSQINSRISSQLSDEEKMVLANFVVVNDDENMLIKQTLELISYLNNI